jgi:hypothetical protein
MPEFAYFNTDAIPDFAINFNGVGAMHPDYRKYATQQRAIAGAVRPLTSCLPLALWHGGVHFQKHVRLELAPFDRKDEAEKSFYPETNQNYFRKQVFYDSRALKVAGRGAKRRALGDIIDRNWEIFASDIGSNSISVRHICDDIISENWAAKGRITEFSLNRRKDKAAALLFEATHSGIVLSLAIVARDMTWTKAPIYKARMVSTRPLYCYGTKLTWPTVDSIRVMGRFNQPDLIVPIDGNEVDFTQYDTPQERSERCGGGLFYYDNSNSPCVMAQAERISEFAIRSPKKIVLPTTASLPLKEQRASKFISDYFRETA